MSGAAPLWVLGFDLSLTAPAAVAIPRDWRLGDWARLKWWLGKSPEPESKDDMDGQFKRYRWVADWAVKIAASLKRPFRYGVEQYAFNKNNANASKLMGVGEIVRLALYENFAMVPTVVSTSEGRKLLLGQVPQKDPKIAVQDALFNKGRAPKVWEENICDAYVVANWMLTEFGMPALSLGAANPRKRKR